MTSKFDEQYAFREALVAELGKDLLGPGNSDEILTDPPITTYITGILYPIDSGQLDSADGDDDADDLGGGEEGSGNPPVSLANVRYPSSMGLTFAVDTKMTQSILVGVRTARYEPFEAADDGSDASMNPEAGA